METSPEIDDFCRCLIAVGHGGMVGDYIAKVNKPPSFWRSCAWNQGARDYPFSDLPE